MILYTIQNRLVPMMPQMAQKKTNMRLKKPYITQDKYIINESLFHLVLLYTSMSFSPLSHVQKHTLLKEDILHQ